MCYIIGFEGQMLFIMWRDPFYLNNDFIEVQRTLFPPNDDVYLKLYKWVKLSQYWKLVTQAVMLPCFLNYFILAGREGRET